MIESDKTLVMQNKQLQLQSLCNANDSEIAALQAQLTRLQGASANSNSVDLTAASIVLREDETQSLPPKCQSQPTLNLQIKGEHMLAVS